MERGGVMARGCHGSDGRPIGDCYDVARLVLGV